MRFESILGLSIAVHLVLILVISITMEMLDYEDVPIKARVLKDGQGKDQDITFEDMSVGQVEATEDARDRPVVEGAGWSE